MTGARLVGQLWADKAHLVSVFDSDPLHLVLSMLAGGPTMSD